MSASVVLFAFFKIWISHSICHNIPICYSFSVCLVVFILNHLTLMFPVPLGKIRMNVEIWKQDEERYHVENQGTLHPKGIFTFDVKWNNTMTEKNAKLCLQGMITITKIHNNMIWARARKYAKLTPLRLRRVTLTCKIVFSLPSSKQIQSTLTTNVVNLT